MIYDPKRPRETSPAITRGSRVGEIAPQHKLQIKAASDEWKRRKIANPFGDTGMAPTAENPYGSGLGYDPKDPRTTARGKDWFTEYAFAHGLMTLFTRGQGLGALQIG